MGPAIGCLRRSKLVWFREGQPPEDLASPYAEQLRAREAQLHRKNSWKTSGTGARFMGQGARDVLWGETELDLPVARVVGAARGREPGEVFYAISTGVVSGIFAQTVPASDEARIFHGADANVFDLSLSVEDEALACSVRGKGGTSAIAIFADDGRGVRLITEGDVVDRAPRWVPGGRRQIMYCSAGIGRTEAGVFGGLAPFAIHRLSLTDGSIEVVAASADFDYLAPVPVAEDAVYAIRRPYEKPFAPPSFSRVVGDALLAPFRLVFALFQYLNFFASKYTGRPLLTSGNARQKAADARQMRVWGNLVDVSQHADEAAERSDRENATHGYELVRITRAGVESVRQGVVAFDIARDGSIYCSTGSEIVKLSTKSSERIARMEDVEHLVVLD